STASGAAAPATDTGAGGNDGGQSATLTLAPDPNEDADVLVTEQIRNEVKDALELADFIVKTGARRTTGQSVPPELIKITKVTAGRVKLFDPPKEPVTIKASVWTRFELAYYALVEFTSPVTVETLRNTRNTGKGSVLEASPAQKFTWLLWGI